MARALRCTVWPAAGFLLWLSASGACLAAGGGKIVAIVEPAYTACLSARSSCTSVFRTQFRVQYKPLVLRTFSLRVRVSRTYQLTLDDNDDGSSEEQQASKLNPPVDVLDVKARFSEPDGRDHFEARIGYLYQFPKATAANGYHSAYFSGDYYFGGPIQTGTNSLSRRFDVLVRFSRDLFAMAGRPAEGIVQLVPTYTLPLNRDGSTRMSASYARELRLSGGRSVPTPSNRFDLGATRDLTPWLELYSRLSLFGTQSVSGTTKLVFGGEITI